MPANSIGSALAIATGLPGAFTEVGYEAMTWVTIGGVEEIGEFGDTTNLIGSGNLLTGRVTQLKGGVTGDTTPITLTIETADTGQIALIAAARDQTSAQYSIRVSEPGGAGAAEYYFSGVVTNYKPGPRSLTELQKFSVEFTPNYVSVSGT
jgi:hypothetical protein